MKTMALPMESLSARVQNAESRLLERRRLLGEHGVMLRHRVHQKMTSPAVLGSAASFGFFLGESTRDLNSNPNNLWIRLAVGSMPWLRSLLLSP